MLGNFLTRPVVIRTVVLVVATGVLLGGAAAFRSLAPNGTQDTIPFPRESRLGFASYFIHLLPGRTPDGSRPRAKSQLLRATKFLAGERVGLRAQTAPERTTRFSIEVRFLTRDTREEQSGLERYRQRFRIRPGLRTYCCLRMPRSPGEYHLGILADGQYIAYLPITVKEAARRSEGGLFVTPED